ncbi:MAG: hypothetical protein O2807_14150 [bacterium]|nr:hypothetical protein [bacterium]
MSSERNQSNTNQTGDPRVSGIATVGWITLAGLALCVPLSAIIGRMSPLMAGAIPLALIVGAGLMAVRIWSSGEKLVNQKENEALKNRIEDLEDRLKNLEMIDSLEAHFAEKHRPRLAEASDPPTMGPPREETAS